MRTDAVSSFDDFDDADPMVSDSDLVGYSRPCEVADDPELTLARRRELLAYWASDIHAVAGAPALRSLATGVTVGIDEIMEALRRLDYMVEAGPLAGRADAGLAT